MDGLTQAEAIVRGAEFGRVSFVEVTAGQKLYGVMPDDTVVVHATIDYRGPYWADYFYVAIGEFRGVTWPAQIGLFDEIWSERVEAYFDASADWVTYPLTVEIPITKIGLAPWTPGWFDIYAKLDVAEGKAGFPKFDNVIEILLKPEFDHFTIDSYDVVS
ncbi:unnamed protein product [marine sediment metagenome]|uniref:Uncharacterized protein n=1 Tax=marine sediment metagenome TaxID=412755 RepID=X1THC9_9ZZZZ